MNWLIKWSIAIGLLTVVAPTALADNIWPTNNTAFQACFGAEHNSPQMTFCMQDSNNPSYFIQLSHISGTGETAIVSQINSEFNPTDLNLSRTFSPVYSAGGNGNETDVIFQALELDASVVGIGFCEADVTSGGDTLHCDQHYVVVDRLDFGDPATPDWTTICHETGHTMGLTHGLNASPLINNDDASLQCMRTPWSGITTLGPLNVGELNRVY